MSESQEYEEITVTSDGVAVTKTFEEDSFPVPAIAFRIRSERTESVTVRLVDDVPDTVAVEDLGFHPEYGSEYWTIEDDEITFEREIDPEGEYTTVYGIRAAGTDDIDQFPTEPDLTEVDPPLEDGDSVVSSANSDVVRDVISGDSDTVPGLEEDEDVDEAETEAEAEEEGEDIGTIDLADPDEDAEADADGIPDAEEEPVDAGGPAPAGAADDEDDTDVEATDEVAPGTESGQ